METIREILGAYCQNCSTKHMKPISLEEIKDDIKKKKGGTFHRTALACKLCGAIFVVSYIESEHKVDVERVPNTYPLTVIAPGSQG